MKFSIGREDLHHYLYLFGLALLVCCLPLSKYLLSISQFMLAINWILEGRLKQKIAAVRHSPSILVFAFIFVLYVIGFLFSANMETGAMKIKNALPLLLFPVIMGTSRTLSRSNLKVLLLLFSSAVLVSALVCLINFWITGNPADGDFRKISVFMLHIRFSLLVNMAVFIFLYLTFQDISSGFMTRLLYIAGAAFLTVFLFFLQSFTGIIILMAMTAIFFSAIGIQSRKVFLLTGSIIIIIGFIAGIIIYATTMYVHNFHARPVDPSSLESYTVNGNAYSHNISTGVLENGHYIDLYVCEPELRQVWNRRSRLPYDSTDHKGQSVSYTLRRYLTSRGLRKDSAGLSQLESIDIQKIENGLANYRFNIKPGASQRLYETLWEIHLMSRTGYVQRHSLGQRIAFLAIAGDILKDHIWTGVGTGDVYTAMLQRAKDNHIAIDPAWEGKPHNQFVFYILSFGIPGFLVMLLCFLYPVYVRKTTRFFLFNIFAGIAILSMFTLDTLESYDSIVFFAFFYTLFVFGTPPPEKRKPDNGLTVPGLKQMLV